MSKIASVIQHEQELRELCSQRMPYEKIAEHFGVPKTTVMVAVRRLKIEDRSKRGNKIADIKKRKDELRELVEQKIPYAKIGEHFGVAKTTIVTACKELEIYQRHPQASWNSKWDKEREKLLAMLRQGMSRGKIAAEYGVPRAAIIGACHRLGLNKDEQVQLVKIIERRKAARRVAQRAFQFRKAANSKPKKPPISWEKLMLAKASPDSSTRCTLLELERGRCRYPVDDVDAPIGGFYCGAPTETGSWCPYHAKFVNRELSGDVGGSLQRHHRQGVETVHNGPPAQVTARPHPDISEAA